MKVGKLDIAVFLILLIIVVFIGAPLLASSGPIDWIAEQTQSNIADPSESFDDIQDIQEAALVGDFRGGDTFQTSYTQNVNSCNTYTLNDDLELVDEENGMVSMSTSTTLTTYGPTAITCVVDSSVVEGDEDKEVLVMLLDYDSQNGEYIVVDSVEELRNRQDSRGLVGFLRSLF